MYTVSVEHGCQEQTFPVEIAAEAAMLYGHYRIDSWVRVTMESPALTKLPVYTEPV